jgi:hypothetical protein
MHLPGGVGGSLSPVGNQKNPRKYRKMGAKIKFPISTPRDSCGIPDGSDVHWSHQEDVEHLLVRLQDLVSPKTHNEGDIAKM